MELDESPLDLIQNIYKLASGLATDKGTLHSYLDVYAVVFGPRRHEVENVMEIGVMAGGSMVLWERFFPKAKILGVDVSLHNLRDPVDPSRTSFLETNAYCAETLCKFQEMGVLQDVIIDDGPHTLESMLFVASNFTRLLKPDGILVIEDVQHPDWIPQIINAFPEEARRDVVVVDRRSVKKRYDDILIIYRPNAKRHSPAAPRAMTLITPCSRPENLHKMYTMMAHAFEFVEEWIIVYDGKRVGSNPNQFAGNPRISEYLFDGPGVSGNPQRNFALDKVSNWKTWIYFLDDDNVVHPRLFDMVRDVCTAGHVYSFNQMRPSGGLLRGDCYRKGAIDTAQVLVWGELMSDMRWEPGSETDGILIESTCTAGRYVCVDIGDGKFIEALHRRHGSKFVFVDRVLSYYNALR